MTSWSTMRAIALIAVFRLTVTSIPTVLPGMFPNRFAWPPDLPMTMFCEPCGPLLSGGFPFGDVPVL